MRFNWRESHGMLYVHGSVIQCDRSIIGIGIDREDFQKSFYADFLDQHLSNHFSLNVRGGTPTHKIHDGQ